MEEVTIIGVDLAKNVFQLHGAAADGSVVYRKKLSRPQFARFMGKHPACEVAMEACPSTAMTASRSTWVKVPSLLSARLMTADTVPPLMTGTMRKEFVR